MSSHRKGKKKKKKDVFADAYLRKFLKLLKQELSALEAKEPHQLASKNELLDEGLVPKAHLESSRRHHMQILDTRVITNLSTNKS